MNSDIMNDEKEIISFDESQIIEPIINGNNTVENAMKTSGTVSEEEVIMDASKPANELLDEYQIKMDASKENKKSKRNIIFILIIVLLIIAFIIAMPFIVKKIGF